MNETLKAAVKQLPPGELLQLTEGLRKQVQDKIAREGGTREEIEAVNAARKAVAAHKAMGAAQ